MNALMFLLKDVLSFYTLSVKNNSTCFDKSALCLKFEKKIP